MTVDYDKAVKAVVEYSDACIVAKHKKASD